MFIQTQTDIYNIHTLTHTLISHSSSGLRHSALAARQNLSDFLNGSSTRGQQSEGGACLRCPPGQEAEDRKKTEQGARLLL